MRHKVAHRKLGRVTEHRIAMLRNQAEALLRHERIQTTVPRAKELRPFVEHIITLAKRGVAGDGDSARALHFRRLVLRDIADRDLVRKLFDELATRYATRPGGYTRLLRIGFRRGDSAEVAQVELVGSEYNPAAKTETPGTEEKPKAKGVGGRLRAAAERVRRRKGGEEGEGADQAKARTKPPRVAQKRTAPTKRGG
ncbi:MAG: 50S ribosomal protein L17 [Acidobacteria bacterium]|nr:50S ribosomal protein L17 [Acidobacteriota bacterium]